MVLPPPHFFGRWDVEKCTSRSEKCTSRSEKITSRSTFSLLELIFSLLEVYFSLLEVHFSTFQRPKKWGGGSIFIGRVESIHSNKEFEFPKKKIRAETTPSPLYLINWIGIWNLELGKRIPIGISRFGWLVCSL